jgi:hypothetical protein
VDEARLMALCLLAEDAERTLRMFLAGGSDSPSDVTEAWRAYRGAVGLRKALEQWIALRRRPHAQITGAVEA